MNLSHRKSQIAIFLFSSLLVGIFYIRVLNLDGYTDFDVYYAASKKMLIGRWLEIYDLSDGRTPFRYPPMFLPLFGWLAHWEYPVARQLWFCSQALAFIGSFFVIFRTCLLLELNSKQSIQIVFFSLLLSTRFIIDSFLIGQVASFMLLAYCWSLYFWIQGHWKKALLFQLVPTCFKIGPGVTLFTQSIGLRRSWWKLPLLSIVILFFSLILTQIWIGSQVHLWDLVQGWIKIVKNDQNYIDSSHYGSQSVLSFLLRLTHLNLVSKGTAYLLANIIKVSVICGLIWVSLWASMVSRDQRAWDRAVLFSLSIFPYVWLMPQTFKYSMHPLVIPLFLALIQGFIKREGSQTEARVSVFIFGVLVSLAGKDIIGNSMFFLLQKISIPLLATFPLAFWNIKEVIRKS